MTSNRRTDARLALGYVLPLVGGVVAFAILAVAGVTPLSALGAVGVAVAVYFVASYARVRRGSRVQPFRGTSDST